MVNRFLPLPVILKKHREYVHIGSGENILFSTVFENNRQWQKTLYPGNASWT